MSDKITLKMIQDFAEQPPTPRRRERMPVSQWLYDAAPPEWKPLLIVSEKMQEPTPVERGVLIRYQRKGRR